MTEKINKVCLTLELKDLYLFSSKREVLARKLEMLPIKIPLNPMKRYVHLTLVRRWLIVRPNHTRSRTDCCDLFDHAKIQKRRMARKETIAIKTQGGPA